MDFNGVELDLIQILFLPLLPLPIGRDILILSLPPFLRGLEWQKLYLIKIIILWQSIKGKQAYLLFFETTERELQRWLKKSLLAIAY